MNSTRKSLTLLVATLAPLGSPTASAVGLGELVAQSSLGEPLRAELRLVRAAGEELDVACFKRVGGSGNDDVPWIYNTRLRLAGDRLLVTTREPVNHPIAMLGVQYTCGGELRRDYPILLQPPLPRISAPVVASTTEARADAIEDAARPPKPPRSAARPAHALIAPSAETAAGDTARPARTRAESPRNRRPEPPRHDRLILGGGAEAGLTPLRMSLMLARPPAEDAPDGTRAQLRQEQRTLTEIDDRIAAQLEVNEKIKRLEEYQAMLKERVAQLGDAPATAGAPTATSTPPSPRAPSPVPARAPAAVEPGPLGFLPPALVEQVREWSAPLGGLLAVLLGGGALLWLRRRRHAETFETPEPTTQPDFRISAPPSAAAPTPPPVERAPTPLPPEHDEPPLQHSLPPPVDNGGEWADPTFAPAHPIPFDEAVDEQDSALELAEIMMSFGRTQGAAETLADYIRNNPRQAVKPWLKLLEVYHVAGMRAEFEVLTRQLNKTFNVKLVSWNDFNDARATPDTVEQLAHICQRLQDLWGTQDAQIYIHQILRDNRNGTRQGFPLTVVEELLLLLAILDEQLGAWKAPTELTLEPIAPANPQAPMTVSPFEA